MGSTAAQKPQQYQQGPDGDAEKAHVDELPALIGERPEEFQEGAPVHAHPDPHGQQGQPAQLQEDSGKQTANYNFNNLWLWDTEQLALQRTQATFNNAEQINHLQAWPSFRWGQVDK